MKIHISGVELASGKLTPAPHKKAARLAPTLFVLLIIPLYLFMDSSIPPQPLHKQGLFHALWSNYRLEKQCNVFRGEWIPYPNATYYTNETCKLIIDQQNCLKFGRPDTDFLRWRWKPNECELPRFNAVEFLEIVKGKSLAFVGDSVGRNQMQSLACLLAGVSNPEDITLRHTSDTINFRRWFFAEFNFTLASFWSPFLVKAVDSDSHGRTSTSIMSLYLDEPEETWAREVDNFDYVIMSAGQWFYRPMIFYEKGKLVGCSYCRQDNMTAYYGYRTAFRTAFRTLLENKGYKGVTFLRTFSPAHFENGLWNDGGNCARTKPFGKEEAKLTECEAEFYKIQVEEYKAAEREGKKFKLLDTTEASLLRPDGHPNNYGRSPRHKNTTFNDCVHWCVPGPIDLWNELLFHTMKPEIPKFSLWK